MTDKNLIEKIKKGGGEGDRAFQSLLQKYKSQHFAQAGSAHCKSRRMDMTRDDFLQLSSLSLYKVCLSVDDSRIDDDFKITMFWRRRFQSYVAATWEERTPGIDHDIEYKEEVFDDIDFRLSLTPIQKRIWDMIHDGLNKRQIREKLRISWEGLSRILQTMPI